MWSVVIEFAEHRQRPCLDDVPRRRRGHRHAGEVGRVLDVGRLRRPAVGRAAGHRDRAPAVVAVIDVGIARAEHLGWTCGVDQRANFLVRRPDVLQVHRLAVAAGADRLVDHVGADRALEREGDDQRRRGEIIGAAIGRHASFEIAVAREHADRDQVVVVDRLADRLGQRPRIADAGGAAIADEVEAERVQVLAEAALVEIVGDHLASRARGWS